MEPTRIVTEMHLLDYQYCNAVVNSRNTTLFSFMLLFGLACFCRCIRVHENSTDSSKISATTIHPLPRCNNHWYDIISLIPLSPSRRKKKRKEVLQYVLSPLIGMRLLQISINNRDYRLPPVPSLPFNAWLWPNRACAWNSVGGNGGKIKFSETKPMMNAG